MIKKYLLTILTVMCLGNMNTFAQCLADFNVWQDTSANAQPSTYFGNNTSIGSNFMGIDTINYTYTWSWGDGSSTVGAFPMHVYATPGNYTICLYMNAINPAGCDDTTCITQTINKNRVMYSVTIINPFVVTSITETAKNQIEVFPNPAMDFIQIKGISNQPYHYQIYNVEGRVVDYGAVQSQQSISIQQLPKGLYVIRLNNGAGEYLHSTFSK